MSDSNAAAPFVVARKLCPVCGKVSYSAGGIHPQCAAKRSDVPPERPRVPKAKQNTPKPVKRSWSKTCPECKTEVHVRLGKCGCGHIFQTTSALKPR